MQAFGIPSNFGIENHGFQNTGNVYWNYASANLIEEGIKRNEIALSCDGAVIAYTGKHTGRSPNDKFIVKYPHLEDEIWWGKVNQPISPQSFDQIYNKFLAYFQGRDLFVQDVYAGAHPNYRLTVRIITEKAWHNLFSRNLLIPVPVSQIPQTIPDFVILQSENFQADPKIDGVRSGTVILIDFEKKIVLIGGTGYAGEIKKSIFTIMNYLLPKRGVLSMHCSANVGKAGDVALFFGLSGTGKTTLSSDPERQLIGDDEHGWSDEGIFNIEGGCYAKTIRLNPQYEPMIWSAVNRFGAVLENVPYDPVSRLVDFDSDKYTENTRGAYPLSFIPNSHPQGFAGHPKNIFFLTADAFGVMPPIARLTYEQAMYYFLSGYTSKLAGTETGLGAEPQATFSTCFGAPFLPLHPNRYSDLLGEKIIRHNVQVWLVNTGWIGGPYGVGKRINLPYTRAMIHAALNHDLDEVPFRQEPFFGLHIPLFCPGVPSEVLNPQYSWKDKQAYQEYARNLIVQFENNCAQFAKNVPEEVLATGPHS